METASGPHEDVGGGTVHPRGGPSPHHPLREKSGVVGALLGGDTPASALETLPSGQPLEEQLRLQLVLITLTHELRSVWQGVWRRAPPQNCLSLQMSPPAHYLPGWGLLRGAGCPRRDNPQPDCHRPSSSARLALGSPWPWPSSLALLQKLPTPRNHPGWGASPSPLTQNSDVLVSVCRVFAEQNARALTCCKGQIPADAQTLSLFWARSLHPTSPCPPPPLPRSVV